MTTIYCCATCGSLAIQTTAWVDENTGTIADSDGPVSHVFCAHCETDVDRNEVEELKLDELMTLEREEVEKAVALNREIGALRLLRTNAPTIYEQIVRPALSDVVRDATEDASWLPTWPTCTIYENTGRDDDGFCNGCGEQTCECEES